MRILVGLLIIVLLVCAFIFLQPGGFLVVNNPQKSDVVVVLGGESVDDRYWKGMELLRAGYAQHLVLDATTGVTYGQSLVDLARNFVAHTAGGNAPQVSVCPIEGDSTKQESREVASCFRQLSTPVHSAIIATDDYHTRRALSIFQTELPQYRWTVAAAHNDYIFGLPWWKHREWAKTYLLEWQKLIWWEAVDRWRK